MFRHTSPYSCQFKFLDITYNVVERMMEFECILGRYHFVYVSCVLHHLDTHIILAIIMIRYFIEKFARQYLQIDFGAPVYEDREKRTRTYVGSFSH